MPGSSLPKCEAEAWPDAASLPSSALLMCNSTLRCSPLALLACGQASASWLSGWFLAVRRSGWYGIASLARGVMSRGFWGAAALCWLWEWGGFGE